MATRPAIRPTTKKPDVVLEILEATTSATSVIATEPKKDAMVRRKIVPIIAKSGVRDIRLPLSVDSDQVYSFLNANNFSVIVGALDKPGVSIPPATSVWLQARGGDFSVIGHEDVLNSGHEA